MYRYSNGQISLSDFKQPVGMNLKENNRWVKKAQTIPWPEIEKRYAALFTNRKGNVAKPPRLALGACIIQTEYGYCRSSSTPILSTPPAPLFLFTRLYAWFRLSALTISSSNPSAHLAALAELFSVILWSISTLPSRARRLTRYYGFI